MNQTFLEWTGHDRAELVGRRLVDLLTPGGRIYHETHVAPLLSMQGSVRAIAVDVVRSDHSRMPVMLNARLRTDSAGRALAVRVTVFDATDRRAYETELLTARRAAERAASWVSAVEQVVADLARASGVGQVCAAVARAGPRALSARSAAVWLVGRPGAPSRAMATSGHVAATVPDLPADDPLTHDDLLRRGSILRLRDTAAVDAHPRVWAALGAQQSGELVLVPLTSGGATLGVLALHRVLTTSPAPEGDGPDVVRTLGRQAGQALARAQIDDEYRRVATTLQHSMLTTTLPVDPRLTLSACYRPAGALLEVGGDWYDAFQLDADRIGIVVGDVVGRGLQAAAAMGQLRSAVRALATSDTGPAWLLGRLDRFVEGVPAAEMATLAYAEVDLRDGRVRYACAGHPPPVLIDAAGRAVLLWDGRSAPLGAHFGPVGRPEATALMTPGARLTLYTDGLVERRDEALDDSIAGLVTVLETRARTGFPGWSTDVADASGRAGGVDDDVCVLALAYREGPTFESAVRAELARVSALRADLTRWLSTHGVVGEDHDAVLLACSEIVGNAVEHGYGADGVGVVDVLVTLLDGVVSVRVRDVGHWRPPGPSVDRGRGLMIVRALMDEVRVEHGTPGQGSGTVVHLSRRTGG